MKKTTLISTFAFAFLMLFSINTKAQDFPNPDKSPMDVASFPSHYKESNKQIKITYSRPQLRSRPLEKLIPVNEVWRTGANEAAELTLYKPMQFGNNKILAGTYTFYLLQGEKNWTAIISKDTNVWGSYFYTENNDVARITIEPTEGEQELEYFSIVFEDEEGQIVMNIGWGKLRLKVPFYPKV